MSTNGVSGSNSSSSSTTTSAAGGGFAALKPQDFVNMLVAELKNQDPTQPMDSSQIITEMSQIDDISTNQQLDTTLQSVLLGQNISSASSLLDMPVSATDASGNAVSGTVGSVSIDNGVATLNIGGKSVPLSNVTEILPYGSTATTSSQGG